MPTLPLILTKLGAKIYQIKATKPGSHSYLLLGDELKVLIDPGIAAAKDNLQTALAHFNLGFDDINLVILTHEHYDHIGAVQYFLKQSVIAASRFAASKINLHDEYVTLCNLRGENCAKLHVQLWLENNTRLDLGDLSIKILATPGHTSGCLCVYAPFEHFLISGDTVFARGTISDIATSGSAGDYVNSLETLHTLKIAAIFPGHGAISENPEVDLTAAIANARLILTGKTAPSTQHETPGFHQREE